MNSFKNVPTILTLFLAGMFPMFADDKAGSSIDEIPETWSYTEYFEPSSPADDQWWKLFNDDLLDSLIAVGQENNYDLKMAARRIEIARAGLMSARSSYFPQASLSAGWNKSRTAGLASKPVVPSMNSSFFSGDISVSWEIDLFGKITSAVREQKKLIGVSRAEYVGTMVSVAAEIAKEYFQLRVWQAELQVAKEHSARQDKIVKIAEARYESGLNSKLDVTQAKEVYYSTIASVPGLENSISTAINSIAVLLGVYPDEIAPRLAPFKKLPDYIQLVHAGIPAELLRRRPDIVQAEMSVAANAAAVGVAKKEFLPTLSIDGSIGTQAHRLDDLFHNNSFTYSVAPRLTWTIFSGFNRRANAISAGETLKMSVDNYNMTVLNAVNEVNNAMSSYIASLKNVDIIKELISYDNESYNLSVDLYKQDLTAFSNVVDAQLNVLENANSLIVAEGNALSSLVTLYQALGGGWDGL
ncbi:MAG: TolC family protein [Muribaculaceae bacterium]|nr:TolC family protein [Muribaculaceae bacterium]